MAGFLREGLRTVTALQRLMQGIVAGWPAKYSRTKYLVFDLETSGFTNSKNPNGQPACTVQFGWAVVHDGKIMDNSSLLVKQPPGTMQAGASAVNHITDKILLSGMAPEIFYPCMIRLFQTFREEKCLFVGYNNLAFDVKFLNTDLANHGHSFRLEDAEEIDVGMLYKAKEMGVHMYPGEGVLSFFRRISGMRSHVKWNLALAVKNLGLADKYQLDLTRAHDAGYDAYVTFLLFEELRKLAEGTPNGC